ncbi:hypothetical protein MMC14_008081 [Varicellaria rhodocarpa]|nr:hypothetical protein [Varicellaria rhodocarpa]
MMSLLDAKQAIDKTCTADSHTSPLALRLWIFLGAINLLAPIALGTPISESDYSPQPSTPAISEHQVGIAGVIIGVLGAAGIGIAVGYEADEISHVPGAGSNPGTTCSKSGSWSYQSVINDIVSAACYQITSKVLDWQRHDDTSLMNPYMIVYGNTTAQPLLNEDGFRQSVSFRLYDSETSS